MTFIGFEISLDGSWVILYDSGLMLPWRGETLVLFVVVVLLVLVVVY